jgi:hypothetical protein
MLFSKGQDKLILILDVQSSVVRGSLALLKKDDPPHVLYTYSTNIPWKPHTNSSYLIKVALKAVAEAVESAERSMHLLADSGIVPKKIAEVHFALSSPWIVSQAKTLSIEFPKEAEITHSRILNIIDQERDKLTPKTDEQRVKVIEQKIFDVRLNGYSVADWNGMSAKQLEVSYTVSIAGTRMLERFVEAAGPAARGRRPFFHSSLLLQHIGLTIVMPEREAYALVHIHGELSDVAVMRRNSCIFFASYPFGVRTLVRKIAATTKTELGAADSLLTLYESGVMDQTHAKESAKMIKDIAMGWSTELQKLFSEQSTTCPIPSAIVVYAFAHDKFFVQALKDIYPANRIEVLSIESILPYVSYGGRAEHRRLTGLYAIAIHSMNGR